MTFEIRSFEELKVYQLKDLNSENAGFVKTDMPAPKLQKLLDSEIFVETLPLIIRIRDMGYLAYNGA